MPTKTPKTPAQTKPKTRSPSLLTLFPGYCRRAYQERTAAADGNVVRELRECYLHNGLVLYLGAGVSRSLGLPTWQELIRTLTVTMMSRKVQSAIAALGKMDDEKYWRVMSTIHEDVEGGADYEKPILMMARAIKDELGDDLPMVVARNLARHARRARFAHDHDMRMIHRPPEREKYSPIVQAIVTLARSERDVRGVQAIINYNYDDLIDEILREENVRCKTVRSGKDQVGTGVLACYHVHGILPVYKMSQGPIHQFNRQLNVGNFVFSEDEYHAEYMDPYKWSNMTQMSSLGRHSGLFIGLSMEDPNIRRLLDVTHRQYPEIRHYAILPRKKPLKKAHDSKECILRNLFEQVETSSFQKIGVNVIWVDTHDAIPEVLYRICRMDGQ